MSGALTRHNETTGIYCMEDTARERSIPLKIYPCSFKRGFLYTL